MPTFRSGRNSTIYYGKNTITGQLREFNFSATQEPVEVSPFGTDVKQYVIGYGDMRAELMGLFSGGTSDVDAIFFNAYGQESPTPVAICAGASPVVGERVSCILAHESNYQLQGAVTDLVAVNSQFLGTGGLGGSGTVLVAPSQNITSTGTSSPVIDDGASAEINGGAALFLHVLDSSTRDAGTITVTVETDSGASPDWTGTTSASFSAITAGAANLGSAAYFWPKSTAFNRHVRARWTVTGGATGHYNVLVTYVRGVNP